MGKAVIKLYLSSKRQSVKKVITQNDLIIGTKGDQNARRWKMDETQDICLLSFAYC